MARSFWLRERNRRRSDLHDGLLGIVGGTAGVVAFAVADPQLAAQREADALGALLVALSWLPLVARRRRPWPVFAVTTAACSLLALGSYPDPTAWVGPLIALYSVAATCDRTATLVATAVSVVANGVTTLVERSGDAVAGSLLGGTAIILGAAAWGDRKQVRAAYTEQLELRAAERERERIEAARRAVGAERVRIARELHDVVAHTMSVVTVQSGVGAHVIDHDPGAAKQILETICDTSRDALDEMRRLLGVLRDDRDEPPDLVPAPGLAGLDELADRVTAAGVPVELVVDGDCSRLAPGIDLAAYRIVQEALTNVLKHAGRARVTVEVRCRADDVRLVVADDGRGAGVAALGDTFGHGIVGMRERAEIYGGRLVAKPRPGGGFLVVATLRTASPAVPTP